MVNSLGELNMVERTMNDYIGNLKRLVCGGDSSEGQIDAFIKNVLRDEDIENGNPPCGETNGTGRFGQLQSMSPTAPVHPLTL